MALAFPVIPQELFRTTQVEPEVIDGTLGRLVRFAKSFAPLFQRVEQSHHAREYLEGLLSDLHRKSVEPIATAHRNPRRPLQRFVGAGKWDDDPIRAELHRQVAEAIGDPEGVLSLDASGIPKKGTHSVGVARQWCGRLGKVDNCQVGVFISYSGGGSFTLLDGDLYLPHEWTRRRARMDECHVPRDVGFRSKNQIALELLDLVSPRLPHRWVTGDDEFGRPAWFRRALRGRKETYLLEVPSDTLIRDLSAPPPPRKPGCRGPDPKAPFVQITDWAKAQPQSAWTRVLLREGEKGPMEVEVITTRVRAKDERKIGPRELAVVIRTLEEKPEIRFYLANADANTPRETLARVAGSRHSIEECFEISKDDLGMDHYEVRSWVGWHHHMTMILLAHWFLTLEQRRVGEKNSGPHGGHDGQAPPEAAA